MFRYEATEDESDKQKLKEGTASFKILDASDTDKNGYQLKSKSGNAMMKVTFSLKDSHGGHGVLSDYFLATQGWKIRNLLKAINRTHWYQGGALAPSDLKNLIGQCSLKNDPTPEYPENIKIASYIEIEKAESVNETRSQDLRNDIDDIPF